MKNIKKILAVIIAMAMAMMLALPAFALDATATIEINGKAGQTLLGKSFTVYKLLNATISAEDETAVTYTVNSDYSAALWTATSTSTDDAAVAAIAAMTSDSKVRIFADAMRAALTGVTTGTVYTSDSTNTVTAATGDKMTISGLDYGYYLVVEANAATGSTSLCMMYPAATKATINIKSDYPSVEKKVKEDVSYTTDGGYGAGYNDVADYDIGDTVPFSFYSKVPDMSGFVAESKPYKYIFHDTMSAGLTFDADSVVVTIGGTPLNKGTDFTVTTTGLTDGCAFEVQIADLTQITAATAGAAIRVDYNATLNTNAKIGLPGNPNTVKLEYSSNPYDDTQTNETPEDTVIVFTYELDTTKVDGTDDTKKLKDAEFVLYKEVSSTKYYVTVDANSKVTGWTTNKDGASKLISAETTGLFRVIGLDAGTYYLEETKAPTGYNKLESAITLEIVPTYLADRQGWTTKVASDALSSLKLNGTETTAENKDTVALNVANNKGPQLPSTGGMGTTLFTILGLVLMAGAGVLLIAKRRTNK